MSSSCIRITFFLLVSSCRTKPQAQLKIETKRFIASTVKTDVCFVVCYHTPQRVFYALQSTLCLCVCVCARQVELVLFIYVYW